MLFGMFGGSTLLSEIGRRLKETEEDGTPRRLIHTEKRLSRNLNSDRLDEKALYQRHLERSATRLRASDGEDVVVAVDYTDFSKPRANLEHGMEHVCVCHDGSKNVQAPGYPVVQLEASLPGGNHLPIESYPFSFREPGFKSQPQTFLDRIAIAAPYVGKRAWWTFDRGFDSFRMFEGLDALSLRWVIRLQSTARYPRWLRQADGTEGSCAELANNLPCPYSLDIPRGRGRKRTTLRLTFGIVRITATRDNEAEKKDQIVPCDRSMVVVRGFGEQPLVMLASEFNGLSRDAALVIFNVYRRRWKAEEATRAAKDSRSWGIRLEDLRALKLRGIRRMALLALLLYAFLTELREDGKEAVADLARAVQCFGPIPPDARYRMVRAIGNILDGLGVRELLRWRSG